MSKIISVSAADRELKNLTFKNLQREVIKRGMPFDKISECDYNMLASWFISNYNCPQVPDLLVQYDKWLEGVLKERGAPEQMYHPSLGYSFLEVTTDELQQQEAKEKKIKKSRVKTEQGIMGGTKKALTYQLAIEGKTKQETIDAVLEQWPDASPKSIGIWFNKALKENK